jgi:hypothetical protein
MESPVSIRFPTLWQQTWCGKFDYLEHAPLRSQESGYHSLVLSFRESLRIRLLRLIR